MILCDYGCGQEFKYKFKNGKVCCCKSKNSCPEVRENQSEKIHSRSLEEKETISEKFRGENNPFYGKVGYWRGKTGPRKGMKNTEKANKKRSTTMKETQLGIGNNNWKGGYAKNNIPVYNQFSKLLQNIEKIRRNKGDKNILEVTCAYCGQWFIPKNTEVYERIRSTEHFGDTRFYCSTKCKQECSIYRQTKYPKDFKITTSREVQPELRQLRFKLDNYTCQKCNKHQSELKVGLHCHHVEGIRWEPIESSDLDKCLTLCKNCHKEVHKKIGCRYYELRCQQSERR